MKATSVFNLLGYVFFIFEFLKITFLKKENSDYFLFLFFRIKLRVYWKEVNFKSLVRLITADVM